MLWQQLISNKRLGQEERHPQRYDDRSEFKRDGDRLIYSAPFRRLQNKTQVFPLPGSVFVHNRLTHSLEVSSLGKALATMWQGSSWKSILSSEARFSRRLAPLCRLPASPMTWAIRHSGTLERKPYRPFSLKTAAIFLRSASVKTFGMILHTSKATPMLSACLPTSSQAEGKAASS